jgi:hypothetical protein
LLFAACVVPSSPIFVTLMKEGPGSSETSVLTRATRRKNPEDTIPDKRKFFVYAVLLVSNWAFRKEIPNKYFLLLPSSYFI